jgi:hypothetical protein
MFVCMRSLFEHGQDLILSVCGLSVTTQTEGSSGQMQSLIIAAPPATNPLIVRCRYEER